MSETVFFAADGSATAYCEDGVHLFAYSGEPVAYVVEDSVFAFDGMHLGWMREGWVIDNSGARVFFTDAATGGPVKPVRGVRPVKGVKRVKPVKSVKQVRPVRPVPSLSWSNSSGGAFFRA